MMKLNKAYDCKTAAVIVAAGNSTRMCGKNKILENIGGIPVLLHSVSAFDKAHSVDTIVIVAGENDIDAIKSLCESFCTHKPVLVAEGGETRADSVLKGIHALDAIGCFDFIAIHDGARPLIKSDLIDRVVADAQESGAAIPAVRVKDTIKHVSDGVVTCTPPRGELFAAQTPQVFRLSQYLDAAKNAAVFTDDSALFENIGFPVRITEGDYTNIKITTPDDLIAAEAFFGGGLMFRIGHGYDVHRFIAGRRLVLCGIEIPHDVGLLGHSDADVALHAMSDAVLGALALGDIGVHFPDTDDKFKDADSMKLLQKVMSLMNENGYELANADITIIAEKPRLASYITKMRENIAANCKLFVNNVSVKVTTEENLGLKGEGIGAHCVCLLKKL